MRSLRRWARQTSHGRPRRRWLSLQKWSSSGSLTVRPSQQYRARYRLSTEEYRARDARRRLVSAVFEFQLPYFARQSAHRWTVLPLAPTNALGNGLTTQHCAQRRSPGPRGGDALAAHFFLALTSSPSALSARATASSRCRIARSSSDL